MEPSFASKLAESRACGTSPTGDAINNTGNKRAGPNPRYTADIAQAHQSVNKLAKLTFQRAVVGYGEPMDKGAARGDRQTSRAL
jgi:hypothetical protein